VAGIPLPWILRGVVACCFFFAVALFVRNRQPAPEAEVEEEEDEPCDGEDACVEAEPMPVPDDWDGGETGVSADAMHQLLRQVYACQEDPEPDDGLVYGKNAELRLRMRRRLRQQQEKEKKQEPVVVEELVDPLADKEALEGLLRELGEGPKQPKKKGATIKKTRRRKGAQPTSQGEEAEAEVVQSGTEAATSPSGRVASPSPEAQEQPGGAQAEAAEVEEAGEQAATTGTSDVQAVGIGNCNGHSDLTAEAVETPGEVEVPEAEAETSPVNAADDAEQATSPPPAAVVAPAAQAAAAVTRDEVAPAAPAPAAVTRDEVAPAATAQAAVTSSDSPSGKSGRKANKKAKSRAPKEVQVASEAAQANVIAAAPRTEEVSPSVDTNPDVVRRRIALETEQDVLQKQMQILQSRLLEVEHELKSANS